MKWGILATGTIAEKFADTVNHMEQEDETLIACASRNLEHGKAFASKYGIPSFLYFPELFSGKTKGVMWCTI